MIYGICKALTVPSVQPRSPCCLPLVTLSHAHNCALLQDTPSKPYPGRHVSIVYVARYPIE